MKRIVLIIAAFVGIIIGDSAAATEFIQTGSICEFATELSVFTANDGIAVCDAETDFPSNRLVVFSDKEFDYCGASTVIYDSERMYVLIFESAELAELAYATLCRDINIDEVMPDYEIFVEPLEATSEVAPSISGHLSWGADMMGADNFNNYLLSVYGSTDNMSEVKVAVIDTGIDNSNALFNDRIDFEDGYNFVSPGELPIDDNRHGTHVSGIICDTTLSNVKIIPYKAMNEGGTGSISTSILAIKKAIEDGADVVNMSISGRDSSYSYRRKYSYIFENTNSVFIAAAGNKQESVKFAFPANAENVIAVSAVDSNAQFASEYSNYGSLVDICAPGTAINSTVLDGEYTALSGTSMACPFVSAAAAMIRTLYPSSTPDDVEKHLKDSAIRPDDNDYDEYYGFGILNLDDLCEYESVVDSVTISSDSINVLLTEKENLNLQNGANIVVLGYKDGKVVSRTSQSVQSGVSTAFVHINNIDINEADSMKMFVWESFDSMIPLGRALTIK